MKHYLIAGFLADSLAFAATPVRAGTMPDSGVVHVYLLKL
jgi:hypothetical protein